MSDLNLFQQICLQIFTANMAGAFVGPEIALQKMMNATAAIMVKKWLGKYGWKITWGPRVWKSSHSSFFGGLDNCWMIMMAPEVVYPDGAKYDTYVVAIAGTAVFSATDWVEEDFGVNHVISFDDFTKTFKNVPIPEPQKTSKTSKEGPSCAWGTAWGVYHLVTEGSPNGNAGEGTTILQYLKELDKSGGDFCVIFAGHSLGGALSPFLSLAVKANALIPALADQPENILTFPAAGATPGDGQFRDVYNTFFPVSGLSGYQQWNANFYNSLDIVPQAWSTDSSNDRFLEKIVSIYGHLGDGLNKRVQKMVDDAKARAAASDIIYEPIEGNQFTGSAPEHPPQNFALFLAQAIKQHTKAYYDAVGVSEPLAHLYTAAGTSEGVQKKTAYQAALSLPVLRLAAHLVKDVPDGIPDNDSAGVPDDVNVVYPYDCILAV